MVFLVAFNQQLNNICIESIHWLFVVIICLAIQICKGRQECIDLLHLPFHRFRVIVNSASAIKLVVINWPSVKQIHQHANCGWEIPKDLGRLRCLIRDTKHGTNLYGFTSLAVKKETVSWAHLNCFTTSLGRWYGPDKAIYRLNWSDEVCCLRFESLGTCGLFHKRIFRLGQL